MDRYAARRTQTLAPRVLFYSGGFAPVGGIETFLSELANCLLDRDFQPRLLCWGQNSVLMRDLRRRGVPVRRLFWRWGCRWGWPDYALLPLGLREIRLADVVVMGKVFREPVQMRLGGRRRRWEGPAFVLVTPYRPSELWARGDEAARVLNSFDAIVTQSERFAKDLRDLGYNHIIEVIPYIPPAVVKPRELPPFPPFRLGFLGRLEAQKNLCYLLEAFALIRRRLPVELHLFGDGSEESSLRNMAATIGVAEHVYLHGRVSREGVAKAVDECHLFVFSSFSEGQCLAALEILARGRTIVATPVGVFPELLCDRMFGRLAPLGNVQQFAEAIEQQLAGVSQGGAEPGDVCRIFARNFPREQIIDDYVEFFRKAASGFSKCSS